MGPNLNNLCTSSAATLTWSRSCVDRPFAAHRRRAQRHHPGRDERCNAPNDPLGVVVDEEQDVRCGADERTEHLWALACALGA